MAKAYYGFSAYRKAGEVSTHHAALAVSGNSMYTVGNEAVLGWNMKTQDLVKVFSGHCLVSVFGFTHRSLCVGYQDGSLKVWNPETCELEQSLEGHRAAVSCLESSEDGLVLYTGSFDTTIIAWDLVASKALVKFQGHKDAVTCLRRQEMMLFSGSRDRLVKVWDLVADSCVNTVLCGCEVWDLALVFGKLYVVGNDPYIHVWDAIDYSELGSLAKAKPKKRTKFIQVLPHQRILVVGSGDSVEIWREKDSKEMDKLLRRRRKRLRERGKDKEADITFPDYYQHLLTLQPADKLANMCVHDPVDTNEGYRFKLALAYNSNKVETYRVTITNAKKVTAQADLLMEFTRAGHRSTARTLTLSTDNSILVSASSEALKVWDTESFSVVNTIACGYAVSSAFLPGNRFILLGCHSGSLEIYDILSTQMVFQKKAHNGAIWGISVNYTQGLVATGGADHDVNIWKLPKKSVKLKLVNVISMKDEVLDLKFSPCSRFICAALLDYTIQIVYSDSYKSFLSLYGHKLPVTCFDISSDSMLVASGSADKNLKIWGLDHGDCHKSLFAHEQGLTDVKFVVGTHLVFTSSRDRKIKYWDADKYQCILVLEGHTAEVWKLALSMNGDFLVSTGNDFSVRLWTQTEDQVFLSEEKELAIERAARPEDIGLKELQGEAVTALVNTEESLTAAETIMQCLDAIAQFREDGAVPPHFMGNNQHEYLVQTLLTIQPNFLETALHVLSYGYAEQLFDYLSESIEQTREIELVANCLFKITELHEDRFKYASVTESGWIHKLTEVKDKLKDRLLQLKDTVGVNIAACNVVLQSLREQKTSLD